MNHSLKLAGLLSVLALAVGCASGDEAEAGESPEPAPTVTVTETAEPEQDDDDELTGDDIWMMVASGHITDIHEWFTGLRESDCGETDQSCSELYAEGAELMDEYGDWLSGAGAEQMPDFVPSSYGQDVNLATMALEDLAAGDPETEAYASLSSETAMDVSDILTETTDWLD